MATLFWVYKVRSPKTLDEYEKYAKEKKVPGLRALPFVKSYELYRIDKVFGPAVTDPKDAPTEPPYDIIAKMEVTSTEDLKKGLESPEGKAFMKEWSPFVHPSCVGTIGRIVEA